MKVFNERLAKVVLQPLDGTDVLPTTPLVGRRGPMWLQRSTRHARMGFSSYRSALILAPLITVASFVGATVYTQNRLERLDALSSTIESNAGPSLEYLGRAGVRLRRLWQLVHDGVAHDPRQAGATKVARLELAALDQDISSYLKLTPLPGERDLWNALGADVARATDLTRSVLRAAEDGDATKAGLLIQEVDAAFDRAGRTILTTLEFDASQVRTLARQVRDVRRNTLTIIVVLDSIATAIAIAAAFIAYRVTREHDRLLQAHNSLLSARVTELDRFAGRMAHDVMSPLDTIGIGLALIARNADSQVHPYIERAQRALRRVQQLVEGLLTFARSGARPTADARCSLSEVLGNVVADCADSAHERRIALVLEPHREAQVRCSSGVLTSIVQNLVRNAIKYMGEQQVRRVTVRAKPAGSLVRLEVEDSGPGIPADQHITIFEPFIRGQHQNVEGVGLGLATVKRLTEAHGGIVGVRSTVGSGTLFWVEVPLAVAAERRIDTSNSDLASGASASSSLGAPGHVVNLIGSQTRSGPIGEFGVQTGSFC
jgi:signal transduction histidine kinase